LQTDIRPRAYSICGRPWTHLYLLEDCAYQCPLMEASCAANYRVRGHRWDYYQTLPILMSSSPLAACRVDMGMTGASICGEGANCDARDWAPVVNTAPTEGRVSLKMLAVSVTNYCRGGCRNCFQAAVRRDQVDIPAIVMRDMLEHASAETVFLMGGEVFHQDEVVLKRQLRWATAISTKGIGVTTAGDGLLGKVLNDYRWAEMRFSIDALSPETHRLLRPGINYEDVWANLRRAAALGETKVVALVTTYVENYRELPDLVMELGGIVRNIRINVGFPGGRCRPESLLENNPVALSWLTESLHEVVATLTDRGVEVQWPRLKEMTTAATRSTGPTQPR